MRRTTAPKHPNAAFFMERSLRRGAESELGIRDSPQVSRGRIQYKSMC